MNDPRKYLFAFSARAFVHHILSLVTFAALQLRILRFPVPPLLTLVIQTRYRRILKRLRSYSDANEQVER